MSEGGGGICRGGFPDSTIYVTETQMTHNSTNALRLNIRDGDLLGNSASKSRRTSTPQDVMK